MDADGLVILAVDDEEPALDELSYLLGEQPGVRRVLRAGDALEALRIMGSGARVDVVFSDIRMPGLDGMELARHCARLAAPPAVVFVTAHDGCAVDAYEVGAVDYVLKPVREDRLVAALQRALPVRAAAVAAVGPEEPEVTADVIPVELAGRTTLVPRSAVRCVVADGDYVRLHTAGGVSHLVRIPLSVLEERWADAGFVRVHRSYLVAAGAVTALCPDEGGHVLVLGEGRAAMRVPVSRRRISRVRRLLRGDHGRRAS